MSDNNRQINPLLLIIVILLCLFSGFFLRQSSYDPDYFTKESVASTKADKASSAKDSKDKTSTQNSDKKKTSGSTPSATPEPTQKPTETPVVSDDNDVSTEAAGCFWLTDSLTPDGLPTLIIKNIISIKTVSCRPAGSK